MTRVMGAVAVVCAWGIVVGGVGVRAQEQGVLSGRSLTHWGPSRWRIRDVEPGWLAGG
jgi:hypothetical protein